MKHKYKHEKFWFLLEYDLCSGPRNSPPSLQHWELQSSCIFHPLHPLISSFSELCCLRGPNFLPRCVKVLVR